MSSANINNLARRSTEEAELINKINSSGDRMRNDRSSKKKKWFNNFIMLVSGIKTLINFFYF